MTGPSEERLRLALRLRWLQVTVVAAFLLLAGVFWHFQVVQHSRFREMAENNHLRTMPMRAPRCFGSAAIVSIVSDAARNSRS